MMKKLLFILSIIVLTNCSTKTSENYGGALIDVPVYHDYNEVQNKIIDVENSFKINLRHYYLYFFSTTCSHCEELKDWIIDKSLKREDIYFVKSSQKISIKTDISSTIGGTFAGDIAILGYPSLIEILDQKIIKNVAGKTEIKNLLI